MSKINPSFTNEGYSEFLNKYVDPFNSILEELKSENLPERIWAKDFTVWQGSPEEISNRLGWLTLPDSMKDHVAPIAEFSADIISRGITHVLLIGMGGSSLAPEFFAETFPGGISLKVLDSTDPEYIADVRSSIDPEKTVVIVSTKSGTTAETISLLNYYYSEFRKALGSERAGSHFVAITDPGSSLEKTAGRLNFTKIFLNNPDVGGRFSALSYFGLVPAALIGVDIEKILDSSKQRAELTSSKDPETNVALRFGALIAYFSGVSRDKLTIVTSESLGSFAGWAEQLIAESTGKKGNGVLPVIEKNIPDSRDYGDDRFFVFIMKKNDKDTERMLESTVLKGQPAVCFEIMDMYEVGGLFFQWEFSTAVCGARMGVNPFDQPDVEYAKSSTRNFIDEYKKSGTLSEPVPAFIHNGLSFFSQSDIKDSSSFGDWLSGVLVKGGYLCLQTFLRPSVESERLFTDLVDKLEDAFSVPVTFGFGPRYLHSTGQLHKGDGGKGVFLQFVTDVTSDIEIPDDPETDVSSLSFGILISAQSLGDYTALGEKGRSIVRINLGKDIDSSLKEFKKLLGI